MNAFEQDIKVTNEATARAAATTFFIQFPPVLTMYELPFLNKRLIFYHKLQYFYYNVVV